MIAYLSGTIQKKLEKNIIVNVNGVGYLVHCPQPLLDSFTEGVETELYLFTKVREDDISLYGFRSVNELNFFKLLLSVNGIGPKLALEIMGQDLHKVKSAVLLNDLLFLSSLPGIGKKTAERLVIELKNKLADHDVSTEEYVGVKPVHEEALTALMSLGYQRFEIERVIRKMPMDIVAVEEMVTFFLKNV